MQRSALQDKGILSRFYESVSSFWQTDPKTETPVHKTIESKPIPPSVANAKFNMQFFAPRIIEYNQDALINKINVYLKINDRMLILNKGYCNGLTMLWLYKMAEHQEDWFYNLTKKIINYSGEDLSDIEMDIEKLINNIEWCQNPDLYTKNENNISQYTQYNCDKLLETVNLYRNKNVCDYSIQQLRDVFNKNVKEDVMIAVASKEHIIGIVQRDNYYYIYDANYITGRAKRFALNQFNALFEEIRDCLYSDFNKEMNKASIPLLVDISRITRQKSQRLAAKEAASTKKIIS